MKIKIQYQTTDYKVHKVTFEAASFGDAFKRLPAGAAVLRAYNKMETPPVKKITRCNDHSCGRYIHSRY